MVGTCGGDGGDGASTERGGIARSCVFDYRVKTCVSFPPLSSVSCAVEL